MGIQVFGTKKCQETKKAERFLKERGFSYQFVDLADKGISKGELASVAALLGWEALVDKEGKRYAERGLAYMDFDPAEELLGDQALLRTPILRSGKRAFLGFDPKALGAWLAAEKG